MCLSMAISGHSFCGSDVGGFTGNIAPEALIMWYSTAAF
jgi:alpha 1,3-glucosidase